MGHTVTACEASVRLEGSRSGEQLRKTRERRKQEPKSRGFAVSVSRTVWESPSFQGGEDVNLNATAISNGDRHTQVILEPRKCGRPATRIYYLKIDLSCQTLDPISTSHANASPLAVDAVFALPSFGFGGRAPATNQTGY